MELKEIESIELIETLWNVNIDKEVNMEKFLVELIETLWNVNSSVLKSADTV